MQSFAIKATVQFFPAILKDYFVGKVNFIFTIYNSNLKTYREAISYSFVYQMRYL